ncbi:ferredoxin [Methanobrevibacter sp. 87.7]|uniref:4Fe-4S binding protein n=1 Tax=Methanobrevibacter sp. 87.7 TaxID=387957 RepID=UPI000B5071C0|nr:4Fe-4S binding protein [Methanobrevibacter sp. 87.7]OWT33528.1 ferredoxin [Methanobrevibacter sp. 87.7]
MSSIIWYVYEFARKAWVKAFADAKSQHEIVEKPARFRDFPHVIKENCIGCGSCTASCPSPTAIKLIRDKTTKEKEGLTYPVINKSGCIRCGFCAEVCPSDPKTLECGENHYIETEFTIIPSKRRFIVDDYLCIKCKACMKECKVDAISDINGHIVVDPLKCIACGDCLKVCKVKGAMKGIFIDNLEDQKKLINLIVSSLEEYIENQQDKLEILPRESLLQLSLPLSMFWDEALKIIPDAEIAHEIIGNAVDRLKIRVITWNSDKCTKCQMCVNECPIGAISFDEEKDTIVRDKDKCCRCSICYQTCPFAVIKYFHAKFVLDVDDDGNEEIFITVKPSQIDHDFIGSEHHEG